MKSIEHPECLLGEARDMAECRVEELLNMPFLLDGDAMDFLEHLRRQQHIHWPVLWGEKIADLYNQVMGQLKD